MAEITDAVREVTRPGETRNRDRSHVNVSCLARTHHDFGELSECLGQRAQPNHRRRAMPSG
jgi:hypothetical protein